MFRVITWALLPVLAGTTAGCFNKWLTFRATRIVAISVPRIEDESFHLSVRCELQNPNGVGATLHKLRYSAKAGGTVIGRGSHPGPLKVRARSLFMLDAPLTVRYRDLPKDFPRLVAGGTLPLTIEASFVAESSYGRHTMQLNSDGHPKIAKALHVAVAGGFRGDGIKVLGFRVKEIGLTGPRLTVRLRLKNAFRFPLSLRRSEYTVFVNGKEIGKGKKTAAIALAPGKSVISGFDVDATHGKAIGALGALLGGTPRFRVKGTLWIDPIGGVGRIPFDVAADATVLD